MATNISPKLIDLETLMADIKRAAALMNIPCADEIVWDILLAYEEFFTEQAVAFRITTKEQQELNVRYQTLRPHDPYEIALQHGFLRRNGHPVHKVMPALQKMRPEAGWLIDIGVTHGLEKIWGYFVKPFSIEEVCAMPFMPPSLRNRLDLFKQYSLNWVSVIGVDYIGHSVNIYFLLGSFPNSPEIAARTIADFGFEVPSQEELEINGNGFVLYPTFTWDSDEVERLSYAGAGPLEKVPVHWHPLIKRFAEEAPLRSNPRMFTFNPCYVRGKPKYYKLEADYHGNIFAMVGPVIDGAVKAAQAASI